MRGERFIRTRKKNPKLKTWITKNMFLITLFWQLIFLTIVAVFEFIFAAHEDANSITNWIAVALGALFQVSSFFQSKYQKVAKCLLISTIFQACRNNFPYCLQCKTCKTT